ncbi:MAG: hypothetical protein DDT39_00412 [Firmicutes bacterium]|nr:hypothetical protein [candidate division NPL-UPA2 bacterium]
MPWKETTLMRQKLDFVTSALIDDVNFTELCAEYGISRKTGYKWVEDSTLMVDGA